MKRFALFAVLLPVLFACERREETAPTMPPPTTQSSPQPTPPSTASTAPSQPAPASEPLAPTAAQASGASGEYTVAEGDTLSGIAREHDVNYQDLATWNNIKDPDRIYPGQTLTLTGPGS